jgi:hypothetical protein
MLARFRWRARQVGAQIAGEVIVVEAAGRRFRKRASGLWFPALRLHARI